MQCLEVCTYPLKKFPNLNVSKESLLLKDKSGVLVVPYLKPFKLIPVAVKAYHIPSFPIISLPHLPLLTHILRYPIHAAFLADLGRTQVFLHLWDHVPAIPSTWIILCLLPDLT